MDNMTEAEITRTLARWLDWQKYPWQIPNVFIYNWECDYWIMSRDGESKEFEIKISRSDYFKDLKKAKHLAATGANYFYYVVPKDLIRPDEVQNKYGLIYVADGTMELVKRPSRLNRNKFHNWQLIANKIYFRYRELLYEKVKASRPGHFDIDKYREGMILDLSPENLQNDLD